MAGENEVPKPDGEGDSKQKETKKTGDETVTISKAELETMKASLHTANEEAKKFRLEGKANKEHRERLEKAWKIAQGEDPDKADPVALEKARTDNKMRWLLVKSAFVSVAASEMHDAEHSFDSVADDLGELEVDLEKGTVDKKAIKERVDELKKNRPYLFRAKLDPSKTPEKKPAGQKEDGLPTDQENPYSKWRDLFQKDKKAATKFYKENMEAIKANMPK